MLKKLLAKLGLSSRSPSGIPSDLAGSQLMVSVKMVEELISIYRSRGVKGDPRARMIGDHLYQMGGGGSLSVAMDKFRQELGSQAAADLEVAWKGISDKFRNPAAARESVALESAGLITDTAFKT